MKQNDNSKQTSSGTSLFDKEALSTNSSENANQRPFILQVLIDIHAAILQRLNNTKKPDEINYFSFSLRMYNNVARLIMVDYKLNPKLVDGQLRYGICLLASSVMKNPGHLQAHHYNKSIDEYVLKEKQWQKSKIKPLVMQEKTVLALAKQGKTNEEIAMLIKDKHQTVRNIQNTIYRKIGVNSMIQAVTYTTHHHLIFTSEQNNLNKPEETLIVTKRRRPITPEKRQHIQEGLNKEPSLMIKFLNKKITLKN